VVSLRSFGLWVGVEQIWQDLTYAARGLWRAPAFTAGAVAVLSLGIGANLTVFQVFDAGIIHRFSFSAAEHFVRLSRNSRDGNSRTFPAAAVDFYRANARSFAALVSEDNSFTISVDGNAERRATFVSDDYFRSVPIVPSLGRVFEAQDAIAGAAPVALLTHGFWRSQFAADAGILERTIHVNGVAVQIAGVLPADFKGLSLQQTDLWLPQATRQLLIASTSAGQANLFGRLQTGVSVSSAVAELTAISSELARRQPRYFASEDRIRADRVQESMTEFLLTRSPFVVVFIAAVLLILVSACAHLANMILVRGLGRQREFAIRIAIGAGRSRLIRQLVTENSLLAVLGSAAGLFLAVLTARLFVVTTSAFTVSLHWQTLAFCAVMTLITVVVFGLPSAREMTRSGFQTGHMRSRLVGNQIAVSCVLLVVTGALATKAVMNTYAELSFDYRKLVVVDPQLYAREGTVENLRRELDDLAGRMAGLPGVESVTVGTAVPLSGRVVDNFPRYPRIYRSAVSPSYFGVMGLPVVRGRTFLAGEHDAVIASEAAARAFWPNRDPLGQLWQVAGAKRTVVGVVQDSGADENSANAVEAYLPISSRDVERCVLVVRHGGDPQSLVGMIPRAAAELKAKVSVTTLDAMVENRQEWRTDIPMIMFGSIGLIATALAAVGTFALLAFSVLQRTREIGIRIAIGASRRHLVRELLNLHSVPLIRGMVKGAFAAAMLLLFIRALVFPERFSVFLYGFALGVALLITVVVASAVVPVMQALKIDPAKALRTD
jgi:predicted permease